MVTSERHCDVDAGERIGRNLSLRVVLGENWLEKNLCDRILAVVDQLHGMCPALLSSEQLVRSSTYSESDKTIT